MKRLREAIQEGGNRGPHAQVCIPTYDLDFQFLKAQVFMHAMACRLKIFKMSTACLRASIKRVWTSWAAGCRTINQEWTLRCCRVGV